MTDVRFDDGWVPLTAGETAAEAVASVELESDRVRNCSNPLHCAGAAACPAPFTCVPQIWRPLTRPACACAVGTVLAGGVCQPMGVCNPNPCRAGTCVLDGSVTRGYRCNCFSGFTGDNCEIGGFAAASAALAFIIIPLLLILCE